MVECHPYAVAYKCTFPHGQVLLPAYDKTPPVPRLVSDCVKYLLRPGVVGHLDRGDVVVPQVDGLHQVVEAVTGPLLDSVFIIRIGSIFFASRKEWKYKNSKKKYPFHSYIKVIIG